jgi:hypothetical protein
MGVPQNLFLEMAQSLASASLCIRYWGYECECGAVKVNSNHQLQNRCNIIIISPQGVSSLTEVSETLSLRTLFLKPFAAR